MGKSHTYRVHPEFTGLEKYVWEGLNQIGSTISNISPNKAGKGHPNNKKDQEEPIWHNKSEIDQFVAKSLNLKLDDYGHDMSINPLYKAIANEIRVLRKRKILIDWYTIKAKNSGMGIWRLDKTKLEQFLYNKASSEMKQKNFHASGLPTQVYVRAKQNVFRSVLLKEYQKCMFCKFRLSDYMIGAHIVPYSVMRTTDPKNSMNPTNGLLLCRLCDVAFERGSILVEKDLGITVNKNLREQTDTRVQSWISCILPEMSIPHNANYPPNPEYIAKKLCLIKNIKK